MPIQRAPSGQTVQLRPATQAPSTVSTGDTVTRRIRAGLPTDSTTDQRVREIIGRPVTTARRSGGGGGGGTAAQNALSSRQYNRCVEITDRGIRDGRLSAADASARGFCLLQLKRPVEAAQAFQLAKLGTRAGTSQAADAAYGSTLALIAGNFTKEAAVAATQAPLSRPRRTELQTQILTQRALAANRDGRYVEALYFLDQRNRIAPMQKDLMLLQGFAYREIGDYQSAEQIFRMIEATGSTAGSRGGLIALAEGNRRPIGGTIIRY